MDRSELAKLLGLAELEPYLQQVDGCLVQTASSAGEDLRGPILRLTRSGKRLRPVLLIAAAHMAKRPSRPHVTAAAAAVEMIHQASLIHDDIIDKAVKRRGEPTINAKEGIETALLAGDFLIAAGLQKAGVAGPEAVRILSDTIMNMSRGQAAQDDSKTAPLFTAACQIGGLCANLRSSEIEYLTLYGENFGLAFQIIDDIRDNDRPRQAIPEAQKYIKKAINALEPFGVNQIAHGLTEIPRIYLNSSLKLGADA
ncbi:MAG TPA: polyprenyl synthetase family protein [Candidatus Saccharimonadales bacterium]|nr:polyprenyl synthetase family protein [Candidatus Saccharimonadales bacterium]